MIDILSMLEVKTRGKSYRAERSLIEQVLYDLRMRYVAAQRQGPVRVAIIQP